LQLEEGKVPNGVFTVRCPKCRNLVKAKNEVSTSGPDLTKKQKPSGKLEKPKAAAPYQPPPTTQNQTIDSAPAIQAQAGGGSGSGDANQLLQALTALLQQGATQNSAISNAARFDWERQRALVCVEPAHSATVARLMSERNYQVYVAQNKTQAVERMREEKMNLVVLSPLFDEQNYGEGSVRQEIDFLRPGDRRRLFIVLITEHKRTMDTHAAFLENVSLIVNTKDIAALQRALEMSIRYYNELYHNFNTALGVGPVG
jgi:translation initiation factor IF-3